MIKTIHIHRYEGTLDDVIAKAISDHNITRDKLISIQYSTRVQHGTATPNGGKGKPVLAETWFASALIIYEGD